MSQTGLPIKGYAVAATLGAIGGGLTIMVATRAIPKLMSRMMSEMMQNMMAKMAADDCDPMER